jgi:colanic acid biosynthesis glycosyl transferase WcaI
VTRCPLFVPAKPTGIYRIAHLASFALTSFPVMLRQALWRPECVLVVEPTLLCVPAALLAARLAGAASWLHVQDFELDAGFAMGDLGFSAFERWTLKVERSLMDAFDRVSTISLRMVEKLRSKGLPAERCVFFPNWVDTSQIYPLAAPSLLRKELSISHNATVVLYSGSLGRKQGIETVIDAARELLPILNLQFVICGRGPWLDQLQAMSKDLTNIRWLPLQPIERLNDLLNLADIHLLPQSAGAADLVMPSKLTGMFASGRPVIATAEPGTQLASTVTGRGIVVPPGNPHRMGEAIQQLAANPALRVELGKAARHYAESQFDKEAVLSSFEQELAALADRTKSVRVPPAENRRDWNLSPKD